jgi:DNA segregation ATPase FtsK/SpoIIIE, S-DNA-T family
VARQKPVEKTGSTPPSTKTSRVQKPSNERTSGLRQDHIERYTLKADFWDTMLDLIPPWADEVAGFVLVIFGVLSLLSVLGVTSDATISAAWSNALTTAFGYGATIVSLGIFLLGVIILLPKFGVVIRFPASRILALEVSFLAILALLHLLSGDGELRALARAGQGGGAIGWALSSIVAGLLSQTVAVVFYSVILVIGLAFVIGIQRDQLAKRLTQLRQRLTAFAQDTRTYIQEYRDARIQREAMAIAATAAANAPSAPTGEVVIPRRAPTQPLLRIRPDPNSIPPSLRPGAQPLEENSTPAQPREDLSQHPLFTRQEENPAKAQIGEIKGKRVKGQPVMVERPDGRMKRYYTVEGMKEQKSIGKRDTSLPPLGVMKDIELLMPDESEINTNVVLIENTLLEFDIDVDVVDVKVGPTVTQYAVQPFREGSKEGDGVQGRTRISKIASLQSDLSLALSARRLRMETPVPGHSYIGIEVPNKKPSVVALRSVYESKAYQEQAAKKKSPLFIPLGRDVSGSPVGIDLSQMPHLLIAGTTGSGKSVCIAAMATALVLENTPDLMKLIMLDPKMVELSRFNGLPHLMGPVETDQERIIGVLRWCTREMDRRYKLLEENAARNIDIFNSRLGRRRKDEYLPYIVILIDEIGDLMLSKPEETEKTITRLAQMARAVGMHMVVATQRPSVDVITGLIKANFPSRISFAVASGIDSRVILDTVGAETLMGRGDMLYQAADSPFPRRLQGCFVSDDEVRLVVDHWRDWHDMEVEAGRAQAITIGPWERGLTRREFLSETDPMLEQAISLVVESGEASASLIQRRLGVGYPRAARIMDLLEELGVVGEVKGGGRNREVLIKPGHDPFKDVIEKRLGNK